MSSPSMATTESTKRDVQRVMAARRALRAYEPYGPTVSAASAPARLLRRTRAAVVASSGPAARSRTTA